MPKLVWLFVFLFLLLHLIRCVWPTNKPDWSWNWDGDCQRRQVTDSTPSLSEMISWNSKLVRVFCAATFRLRNFPALSSILLWMRRVVYLIYSKFCKLYVCIDSYVTLSLPIIQAGRQVATSTSTRIMNNNKQHARVPENCSANKTQAKHRTAKQSKTKERFVHTEVANSSERNNNNNKS